MPVPPRYVVRELEGHAIKLPTMSRGGSQVAGLSVHVLDRLDCWRIVASYRSEDHAGNARNRAAMFERVRSLAAQRAADLNEAHARARA